MAYSKCDNDNALIKAASAVMTEMHLAAGAEEAITIERYAHLVGGCRMGSDERSGVVDRNLRSFAVPNLFITDGSVLPTQGSANPALTIMALAARAAQYLASNHHSRGCRRRTGEPVPAGALRGTATDSSDDPGPV